MNRGPLLLHPVALVAIAVLVVNDHVFKLAWPGWLTGKLSDVAGLVFVPMLVLALGELRGRPLRSPRVAGIAALAVAIGFAAVKLSAAANAAYGVGLGALQWPVWTVVAWLEGLPAPARPLAPCRIDPSDLLALPAVAVAPLVAWMRARRLPPRTRSVAGTITCASPR